MNRHELHPNDIAGLCYLNTAEYLPRLPAINHDHGCFRRGFRSPHAHGLR